MKMRVFAAMCLFILSLSARADFNNGVVALMMGDYDKALSILVPLAETADHAYAQYFVGRMHAAGQGVDKDLEAAAKWYRKAAESGVADAQFRLGNLYKAGDGVPKDMEYAYGWYTVAAHLGNAKAIEAVSLTADKLSPDEMKEAEALSADLIKKYGNTPRDTSRMQ